MHQTRDRIAHPHRGDGTLAYRHGPTTFTPDGGEAVAVAIVTTGYRDGVSYHRLRDPAHGEVTVTVTRAGERHERYWSPLLGEGWLVWESRGPAGGLPFRFEGDDGRVTRIAAASIATGTPAWNARHGRKSSPPEMTAEEERWMTLGPREGGTLGFRRDGPPRPPAAPRQLGLWGAPAKEDGGECTRLRRGEEAPAAPEDEDHG